MDDQLVAVPASGINESTCQLVAPSPALREFIYAHEYHAPEHDPARASYPAWARPYLTLTVVLSGGCSSLESFEYRSGRTRLLPDVILGGAVTHRVADLVSRGTRPGHFTVIFRPEGFYRLFGVKASELTDRAVSAQQVLGPSIDTLRARMRDALNLAEMVEAAEALLLPRVGAAGRPGPIARAAAMVLRSHGAVSIGELIHMSGCGRYRFERGFAEAVGVTPKFFARLARFNYALSLKSARPTSSWMDISMEAGYFDQNHFVKEFKLMTDQVPSSYGPPPPTSHVGLLSAMGVTSSITR